MSLREPRNQTSIHYPSSDGKPMAETHVHRNLMLELIYSLTNYFLADPEVYVSGNLLVYYVEGDPTKRFAPDVFVVRGVGKPERRVYKLWEEGRPPEVVIELSSRGTWREDFQQKWLLYQQLGVQEYFIFEPEYEYLDEPFVAYRLTEGKYLDLEIKSGRVRSEILGLELVDTGQTLRLFDPTTGQFLKTVEEERDGRRQAEAALAEAENELTRLREELVRWQNKPPQD